jgi:hypothetical protein
VLGNVDRTAPTYVNTVELTAQTLSAEMCSVNNRKYIRSGTAAQIVLAHNNGHENLGSLNVSPARTAGKAEICIRGYLLLRHSRITHR